MSALVLLLMVAANSPCDDSALADGPLTAPFAQGDVGVARRACPRTEVAVGAAGRATVERENFYANLRGNARIDVSVQPVDEIELAVAFEPVFYQQVIQSYRASHVGPGDTSVSATLLAVAQRGYALSVMARATLPTAYGYYVHSYPFALDAGVLGMVEPLPGLRVHTALLGIASAQATVADKHARAAVAGDVGAAYRVFDWVAVVVDASAQSFATAPLDRAALGAGVRAAWGPLGVDASVVVPVAGAQRDLFGATLRVSYRLW